MAELRVIATIGAELGVVVGLYDGKRRREGEEFTLRDVKDFSHRWMEALDWEPPAATGLTLPPPGPETAAMLAERKSFVPPAVEPLRRKARSRKPTTAQVSQG
jgi:hypothetical protein